MHRETRAPPTARPRSWIAVEVRGSIAALQSHLVRTEIAELHKEFCIKLNSTLGSDVQLDHPATNAFRIKLFVPCGVKRICKKHTPSITAQFDHLRSTIE